ncbi:MAG TPA: hypothetical protein VFH43_11085 [Candidatus Kapabacteria bacterium]|nr:hypothetical protein [Candidatus Kapabacteria bacterium]
MSKAHFPEKPSKRSTAERVSLAVSAFVVLALVALIVFNRYNKGDKPASISAVAEIEQLREVRSQFYLPVEVTNNGNRTAEAVKIAGTVGGETRDFEISFLDGEEKARGTLVFTQDPRAQLKLEVISFREP